jgi:hypothetical protein
MMVKARQPLDYHGQVTPKDLGFDVQTLTDAEKELVYDIYRPAHEYKDNVIHVLNQGKKEFYKLDDDLFRAVKSMDASGMNILEKIVALPARMLRAGAVLAPEFIARNPVRDQFSTLIYSRYGYNPATSPVKGIFSLARKDDDYQLYRMSGAEHSMLVSVDRDVLQKSFQQIMYEKGPVPYLRNPLRALQVLSEASEKMTRLGEFKAGLGQGASPVEAGFASRDLLDFQRAGKYARWANRYIPFLNATIQGNAKMVRGFREQPVKTSFKTAASLTVPSIALYAINRENPRYQEIPQWQKDLFWIIPLADQTIRIPKPFELGVAFGSVPERVLEEIDREDATSLSETFGQLIETGVPGLAPQAFLPIVENWANKSFFLDRPIVPRGREEFSPENQYSGGTSELSKLISRQLARKAGVGYSPAKIDNILYQYGGGLGRYGTQLADLGLKKTGVVDAPPDPAAELADRPVAKAFLVRDPNGSSSESVDRFYDLYERARRQEVDVQLAIRLGQQSDVERITGENPELAMIYDESEKGYYSLMRRDLARVRTDISDIRKVQEKIYEDRTLTPTEKRRGIKVRSS